MKSRYVLLTGVVSTIVSRQSVSEPRWLAEIQKGLRSLTALGLGRLVRAPRARRLGNMSAAGLQFRDREVHYPLGQRALGFDVEDWGYDQGA